MKVQDADLCLECRSPIGGNALAFDNTPVHAHCGRAYLDRVVDARLAQATEGILESSSEIGAESGP